MEVEELRILVVEDRSNDFISICSQVARASGAFGFHIDHANSVAEATEFCGRHYHMLIVDTLTANTEEGWSKCQALLADPCMILLLSHHRYAGLMIQPALRNPGQFVIRTTANGQAVEMATRYVLGLVHTGRCGSKQVA